MRFLMMFFLLCAGCSIALADTESDKAAGMAALTESRFEDAAKIFSAIIREQPENGEVHYRLGMALMELDRLDQAADQFQAASKAGFQPLGAAYRLARIRSRQGNVAAALEQLDTMAAGGFPAPQLVENEADFANLRGNERFEAALDKIRSNRFPCRSNPKNRLFDFWLGHWDVSSQGQPAGTNDVRLILGDCVVFENWESVAGTSGKSFNFYNAGEDQWKQVWVDDTGGVIEFAGQVRDGVMYYTASTHDPKSGAVTLHKLTFTPQADGSVRQLWEQSADQGTSWTVAFDGRYVKQPD